MARVTHLMMTTATRGPQCSIRHKPSAAILLLMFICQEHLGLSRHHVHVPRLSHLIFTCLVSTNFNAHQYD